MRDGYEDEIRTFRADLETKAGASELNECGSAPAMAGAAGDDALAVFTADNKGSLLEAGDNGYAGCVHGNAIWNAAIGRGHQLMKNGMGFIDAFVELGMVLCECGGADARREDE
jgi:hypothetical protein